MKQVLLIMKRASLAQGLMKWLEPGDGLQLRYEPDYAQALPAARRQGAQAVLLEAAEVGRFGTADCLELCRSLRQGLPGCRLMLMCPEQDEGAVELAIRAKRSGAIDNFVFYDVTMDYLITALKAL